METDTYADEAEMPAHLVHQALATTLAARATTEMIAVGQAASVTILGEGGSAPMKD